MEAGIVDVEKIRTGLSLIPTKTLSQSNKFIVWQGDISRLNADAIVNAANKYLLGYFQPLNAIHSAAGQRLREDCAVIMSAHGELEETGGAKITRSHNLPAKFVLHTVGPIVPKRTKFAEKQREELASSYRSCLDLAN